jgi:hypothetical protein
LELGVQAVLGAPCGLPVQAAGRIARQFLIPGTADAFATLSSKLFIYDIDGGGIGSGVENSSALFETYTATLGAGTY